MSETTDVKLFFNFRSPYCYIASKTMFRIFDEYDVRLIWRPLGGWSGRSAPERAKIKIPLVRQDVRRITRKMGIAFNPPPATTDPTRAACVSLLAEEKGLLKRWIVEVMRAEWAYGLDIGDDAVLREVGRKVGIEADEVAECIADASRLQVLEQNWREAQELGLFGVPSFQVGDELFWGQDRIGFVIDHLRDLRLRRI